MSLLTALPAGHRDSGLAAEPIGHRAGDLPLVVRLGEHVIAPGDNGQLDQPGVCRFGQMRFGDGNDLVPVTVSGDVTSTMLPQISHL